MNIFSLFKKNKNFFSQSGQDQFAYNLIGRNGTYLEIGAHDPIINSNTYKLETNCGWKGLSVEYDKTHRASWAHCKERNHKIIWENAFQIDYLDEFSKYGLTPKIDYLSCDIDPPKNTFKILKLLINLKIEFKYISYEHDKYSFGDKYEKLSKDFLFQNGYKVAVDNVYSRNKRYKIYETWFVKNNINYQLIDYPVWKQKFYKNNVFKI